MADPVRRRRFSPAEWAFRNAINRRFHASIDTAHQAGIEIRLNRTTIRTALDIATAATRLGLQRDNDTLRLFLRAIELSGSLAVERLSYPYHFMLHLEAFLPQNLAALRLGQRTRSLFADLSIHEAYGMLRQVGALEKIYGNPAFSFRPAGMAGLGISHNDVRRMSTAYFDRPLLSALNARVTVRHNNKRIRSTEDIAQLFMKDVWSIEGDIVILYSKALRIAGNLAAANAGKRMRFIVDLGAINHTNMGRNGMGNREIDRLIDDGNMRRSAETLYRIGVLNIRRRGQRANDPQRLLFRVIPDNLLYPQRP